MIRYFAGHPTAANLVMAAFILAGLLSVGSLNRATFPTIEPRRVSVTVTYPGGRPEDVEEAICRRIETAMESVENIAKITCESRESRALAVIEMNEGEDLDRFLAKVRTEIDAIDDFPDKTETPVVEELGRTDFVASVAITGLENRAHLRAYALETKDRMLKWGGITQVKITGFSQRQIRIELRDAAIRQYGLSIADIANRISQLSVELPSGSIEAGEGHIAVRFADERRRVEEFRDLIVIYDQGGGLVRLGDVATITDRFDLAEDRIEFNGKPAAMLDIYKTKAEDIIRVVETVRRFVEHESKAAPKGITLDVINDGSTIVNDRLQLLLKNGAQGLALVFLTLWLFFGLRYAFWVTMGLPVSFLGAIAIMSIAGFSLNMMTMLGLLIAIGLLMDDAIVISENIAAQREKGKTPLQAAIDGAAQVFPSVFSSFLTTALVLGSLMFLRGDIGQILRVVPMIMLFVLSVSLVEAFLILPHHLLHSLGDVTGKKPRMRQLVESGMAFARDRLVGPTVDFCMAWRYATVGTALAVLMIAVSMLAGGILKFSVFPDLDGDTVEARLLLPQGTPLARTRARVEKIIAAAEAVDKRLTREQPDGRKLVRSVTVRYNKNDDSSEAGGHIATVSIDLLSSEIRATTSDGFLKAWRQATGDLPDVVSLKFTEAAIGPAGQDIEIRLRGTDLETLKDASLAVQDRLRRFEGVTNLMDDLRPGKQERRLRLKEQALSLGITSREIANQLRAAFFGSTVSEIQVGAETFEIDVRLSIRDRSALSDLDNFTVQAPDGSKVPLAVVASFTPERGYARINRYKRTRTVTIQADVDRAIANAAAITGGFVANDLPGLKERFPGIDYELGGQNEEGGKTQASMIRGFMIGLVGVFLLLCFQFRSYIEPVVVMILIPLSFIGVVFGHMLLGLEFTMPSMLGFVALAGVVVNNSILLVNFIKDHHAEHDDVAHAAPQAARARFRAIFITTLTTVAGLLPILVETSLQAQVLIPMVASLAFGLVASVIMVLFVVPAIYAVLDDFGLSTLARERREKRQGLEVQEASNA